MTEDPRVARNMGYICSAVAKATPERMAIHELDERGGVRDYTYGRLEERCNRAASLMGDLGLRPGDRVAVLIGNRVEFIEVLLGAMRAGVVAVPLNTRGGGDSHDHIIADSGCAAAFVDASANPHVVASVEGAGIARRVAVGDIPGGWQDYEALLQAAEPQFEPIEIEPDHPLMQPYTSGSTGRPKGVLMTLSGQIWWIRTLLDLSPGAIGAQDRIIVAVPLFHKNAMAGAIKPFLMEGGTMVTMRRFEPRAYLRAMAKYRITQTTGVPALYAKLLEHRELIAELDLSAFQALKIGSAPCQEALLEDLIETFGVPLSQSYGLTEGGPVMIGPPLDGRPVPLGSCGVAWPEGEVKLVDADGERSGSYGELWVRNPGVTPGYHNLPEVNAERLVDGWLKTGDLFELDGHGFYYFRGRTDDMFNCGGENIYPLEVESLIISHPAVSNVCVVPVEHAVKGQVPVAMVALNPGVELSEDALKRHCLENGPAYAHPRRVVFVDEVPTTGAEKIDRKLVQQQLTELAADLAAE